jgi:hypothetical protein
MHIAHRGITGAQPGSGRGDQVDCSQPARHAMPALAKLLRDLAAGIRPHNRSPEPKPKTRKHQNGSVLDIHPRP